MTTNPKNLGPLDLDPVLLARYRAMGDESDESQLLPSKRGIVRLNLDRELIARLVTLGGEERNSDFDPDE